jgi:predicted dehydrogenase
VNFEIPAYQPSFPKDKSLGIGILGCGNIVRNAHLPAYAKHGLKVVGVYDPSEAACLDAREKFGVAIFKDPQELLRHPEVQVVDVATHPEPRFGLIMKALQAGKHVLSQKPLALTLQQAQSLVLEAKKNGVLLAVNQNGRWAPPWRLATLLIQKGVIGQVQSVTHFFDINFSWVPGTPFDKIPHFAIYDYSVHWIDIIRCWMEDKKALSVRARDFRVAGQPAQGAANWGLNVELEFEGGAQACIRGAGCSNSLQPGHPFWIHGSEGTLRGAVLNSKRSDFLQLEKDGSIHDFSLEGQWFNDGFAGSMGELLSAIAEKRQPYNSAEHNLLSLQITLAACQSADQDARPVTLEEAR